MVAAHVMSYEEKKSLLIEAAEKVGVSWWHILALWQDTREISIYGSHIERLALHNIRQEIKAKWQRIGEVAGFVPPAPDDNDGYCYACHCYLPVTHFAPVHTKDGRVLRSGYCRKCQPPSLTVLKSAPAAPTQPERRRVVAKLDRWQNA